MERETENLKEQFQLGLISRRDFLTKATLLGLSVGAVQSLLAACSPPAAPASTPVPAPVTGTSAPPSAATIKRGGTLTHAINWTVPTMDPHTTTLPQHIIYENVYDGLLRLQLVDPKTWELKAVGVLADSWQQTDGKTVVFKLKQGIKFHDGSDFDATVAKWNIERARDHPKGQLKASLGAIETVRAIDKSTLEIKTKTDNAALVRVLSFTNGGLVRMISKAAYDKNGEEWIQRNPVGTGSFKFNKWITDDRVILDRNPDYFLKGADGKALPYLDSIVMRYIPDPTVGLTDMRAGSVQVLEWMAFKDIETVRNDSNLAYVELPWAGQVYFMVGYNSESSPFKDVRVRQAANYAIDRVGMHKALGFGVGEPHHYPYWLKGTAGYDESILKYEYNPAKVKELLTQAGYPNGVDVELKVIAREPENTIGEFVQQ
ncbi:MAG: ABC transporter substrate-binding protein, partial [Chloroflexota bacterium]